MKSISKRLNIRSFIKVDKTVLRCYMYKLNIFFPHHLMSPWLSSHCLALKNELCKIAGIGRILTGTLSEQQNINKRAMSKW